MVLGVGSSLTPSSIMLHRFSTAIIAGEDRGQLIVAIKFGRLLLLWLFFFLCTMLGWLWLCVLAHSLGRGIQSLALPVMQKELGSPETPKQYHFFGLGTAETGIYDISPKTKIVLFFRSTVFVLLNRFQASCTLRGSEPKFLLPSTFAFHEPPDGVFPSNILFWKLSNSPF